MYQYRYQNIFCVELAQFKKDVSKLEREISIKVQKNQMKEHNVVDVNTVDAKETKTLLPKKQVAKRKVQGVRF